MSGIIKLVASNVKRLKAVEITPGDDPLVFVSGTNGSGKTSVLSAIWWGLGGAKAFDRMPVRKGQEEATIELVLENHIVHRTIKADGTTRLEVKAKDGARYPSPQAVLDDLMGNLSFDPLAFTRLKPAAQRELLRKMVGLDTSKIDAARAKAYDDRTAENREVKRLEGELSGVPGPFEATAEVVSLADLSQEVIKANEHRERVAVQQRALEAAGASVLTAERQLEALMENLRELREEIAKTEERIRNGAENVIPKKRAAREQAMADLAALESSAPDVPAIQARIAKAEENNDKVRGNKKRAEVAAKLKAREKAADLLTGTIKNLDAMKVAAIAAVKWPVPGLELDEAGVLLNGIPFEQSSTAEQIRASVAIGLAEHPKLRVLLVEHGKLLNTASLKLLHELAVAADAQVWVEMATDGGGMGVIIEDGSVVGQQQAEPDLQIGDAP